MPLCKVQGTVSFWDEGGNNKIAPTVYVNAHPEDAKVIAIERFKAQLEEHDQCFEHLISVSEERRQREYDSDAYLKALFVAACGEVTLEVLMESASGVVYE